MPRTGYSGLYKTACACQDVILDFCLILLNENLPYEMVLDHFFRCWRFGTVNMHLFTDLTLIRVIIFKHLKGTLQLKKKKKKYEKYF